MIASRPIACSLAVSDDDDYSAEFLVFDIHSIFRCEIHFKIFQFDLR